jgi:cytoskeletal protein RodZ
MTSQIGVRLRRAREAKSLSIEKVSQETHIRLHYLKAMEEGDLEALPSLAQARGFLRTYASYLGLEGDDIVVELEALPLGPSQLDPIEPASLLAAAGLSTSEDADQIFAAIGAQLRKQRELLGFSLQDIEQNTHLRNFYLQALEAGKLSELPSPVQGRGMLSNYATFLGMDPEPLLLKFAEGLQAQLAAKRAAKRQATPQRRVPFASGFRRIITGDLIFGGILILSLTVFVVWAAIRIATLQAEEAVTPTAVSIAEVLLQSPSPLPVQPTATGTRGAGINETQASETQALSELVLPEEVDSAVQVYILVKQRSWMRVLVDGDEAFAGRVLAGSAYPFSGDESVEVLTGNGAGLQVFFNQQDLGSLGFFGEVVDRIYSVEGILNPTPTLTPTVTPTVPATPTPTATALATNTNAASP